MADIFDRVKGYEKFHEILRIFNRVMIQTEKNDEFMNHPWAEIKIGVKTPQKFIETNEVNIRRERDIEHNRDVVYIEFLMEEEPCLK